MNIFKFEFKMLLSSILIWIVAILTVFFVFSLGVYPLFESSMDSVLEVMEGFPPAFAAMFGLMASSMFTFEGYYAFIFQYTSLMGAIMALNIAITVFGREKKSKCQDFLMTKPVNRSQVFFYKWLSILLILIITNILYFPCSMYVFQYYDVDSGIIMASLSLFLNQLFFMNLGVLVAIFSKKIRSSSGIATSLGFGAFILSAIANLLDNDWSTYFSPLQYFNPTKFLYEDQQDVGTIVFAIILIVVCISVSYIHYTRKDINAV